MRAGPSALACAVAIGLTARAAQQPEARYPDLSASGVVRAAVEYVKTYQEQLAFLIADEAYTQQVRTQIPDDRGPKGRTMKSELFFMFTPVDRGWMSIRDVIEVDRKPVEGRPDLRAALETLPAAQVAGTFKTYNSRFNIGRTQRSFNEPILSLLVLDARYLPNFTFDRRRVDRTADGPLVTVTFTEKTGPTLIRDLQLRPVELTTTYAPDERLGLWVPVHFCERYEEGVALSVRTRTPREAGQARLDTASSYEEIVCEAKYTNYRRFEATARIKKQM